MNKHEIIQRRKFSRECESTKIQDLKVEQYLNDIQASQELLAIEEKDRSREGVIGVLHGPMGRKFYTQDELTDDILMDVNFRYIDNEGGHRQGDGE